MRTPFAYSLLMAKTLSPEALQFFKEQGSRGGKKRVANMTKKERSEAARKAAQARWKSKEAPKR